MIGVDGIGFVIMVILTFGFGTLIGGFFVLFLFARDKNVIRIRDGEMIVREDVFNDLVSKAKLKLKKNSDDLE